MPLANAFLTPAQFADEYFFNLIAAFCPRCALVQLVEQPGRDRMFNDHYPFFSSTSARMAAHFERLARDIIQDYLPSTGAFVVEIGSNDGTLLRPFVEAGIRHLGIEPSASVARAATARSVNTVCRFFDRSLAEQMVAEHGQADAVIAANALSHIADLHSVVAGIKVLLAPGGVCVIEEPYWGDVVEQTAFDHIYDEHASYFSLSPVKDLFEQHDLAVFDVIAQPVHGGSMRYLVGHPGRRAVSHRVAPMLAKEETDGLHRPETLEAFRTRISATGEALMALLGDLKRQGKRIVGYGATSKSTTAINHFGITTDLVEFISDTTPAKQGTFTPGAHIPVRSHDEFAACYPDRALLFLWNHAGEVLANEQAFARSGGRWIVYVPAVREF